MFKRVAITISLVIALLVSTTGGLAQGSAPQPAETPDLAEHIPGELLISFNPGMKSAQAVQRMQELGLEHVKEIRPLKVHLVKLPPGLSVEKALERFSHLPGLAFAEPNYIYQITATTQAEISDQWGLGQINAEQAWGELSGPERNPILLATVDTGIDRGHPDLSTNIWINENEIQGNLIDDDLNGFVDDYWGWDFVNNDNDPDDDNMHGTGVSSVMAGVQDGAGVAGVCPWCQVMAVKTLGSNGTGALDVVAEGINYAAQMGARVINLSLTGPHGATLEAAVNNAWSLGVVVVAAAGNNGLNTIMYPSGYAYAMGVASTDENDYHSCFSNHAENSISVSAPGERILIALPNQGYGIYSGTSLSAPHVAGLAGLLFSQDETGTRTNSWVRTQIESSAEDLGPQGLDAAFGHGRIDAYRALGYGPPSGIPEDGVYSISDTASGYAHARKLVRDDSGTLHTVWHTKEGSDYQIKYAYSEDDGANWILMEDISDVVYASENETYHPALATDGEYLFVAFPSRTGPDTNYPYEILFTRKSLSGELKTWEPAQSLMGGTNNAVRPDMYFDPTDGGRLHVIASSLDDAPYLYYRGSSTQGSTWDAVSQFNPSNSTPNTRYATIYANGDNIYVATKTVTNIIIFTYYYLHTARSTDGGVTWIDQTQISSYLALTTGEYGVSLAGVGDRVYMGYEVGSNMYFRRYDGAGWSDFLTLETGDPPNGIVYKWPSITQAEDGQAWMMFEVNRQLYMRHYDGSNWQEKESMATGNYANLKQGTQGNQVEWLYTNCNSSPFELVYGSRSLSGNNPPVADPQGVTTPEDTQAAITLTGSDLDDDPLTYNVVSGPTNGSLGGTAPNLTYTPGANYNGLDSFTFVANDGTTNSNTATVTITVNAVNDPPVADDQAANTDEDTPLAITLTGSDVDGDDLTYSVVLGPADGSLSGTAPNLTYTPNLGYNGVDSFTFKVNDGNVDSNIAAVLITVTEVNNPPIADDQAVITAEDTPVGITLTANDQDGESLTYSIVSGPANGTLSVTAPNLTYTPGANYNGADSFTFVANDGIEDSNIATIDITVTAVNDSPVANPQAVTTDEDIAAGINLTANDVDVEPLTYSVVAGPTNGTLNGIAPGLTYTPNQDYNGSDTFTFKVNDGTVDSNIAIVDITVTAVNDTPLAVEQTVTTDEDTGVAITLAGSDVDGDGLTFSVLAFPANGSLSGIMPDLTYTPTANFNGSDSFNFKVDDGNGENDTATVWITVATVNDSPVANSQTVATDEDTPYDITLTGSDIDGSSLTYSVVTGPANGTLSGSAPSMTYTPVANYNGADSFTFVANDGTTDSNTATVMITVTAVNDPPVADNQAVTTNEDAPLDITLTWNDIDSGLLTSSVVVGPANGTLSGTAPNQTYTPNANFNGSDSFTFKINDGYVDSNTAMVSITVTPINDPPVADNQAVTTDEDVAVAITLTGGDVEGDELTYTVVAGPANGVLSGTAPNQTYTPNENYYGLDSFTFEINDWELDSNTATVDVTVTPVNDPPVANDQAATTSEDTLIDIILTASDVEGGALTFTVVTDPINGVLSGIEPNLTYTPDVNYSGPDNFTFKVSDGFADSSIAIVDITVTGAASVVDAMASGEIFVAGTVSGDYTNTYEDDGAREAITERDSGGKPIWRFSYLEHKWTFEVIPGNAVTLYANAWSSESSDGDSFIFAYSTDDVSYTEMFTVANTSDGGYQSYGLPASIQGTLYVRVSDSDHAAENRAQDTVFVDHFYIRSETEAGDPPNAPTDLFAVSVSAGQIDLSWSHISTDEFGFLIERSLNGSSWSEIATVGADVRIYSDADVSPSTSYYYRVQAYNGSGTSGYSNEASATTGDGLSLTAIGLKVKGVHVVDLDWTGSTAASFDIYRDGTDIALDWAGNSYSDNTNYKGGASYQYQVCEAGSLVNCSNTVLVGY